MSESETLWRRKTDRDVAQAASRLHEYTPEGQRLIQQELARRGLAAPAELWECSNCHEKIEDSFDVCWNCGLSKDGTEKRFDLPARAADELASGAMDVPEGMTLTTTPVLDPRVRHLGVVFGEAIVGANIFRDFLASVTDIVGGRSSEYESALAHARRMALAEMAHRAKQLGANAVLSIDVDYETIRGSMMIVTCCGTAVEVTEVNSGR